MGYVARVLGCATLATSVAACAVRNHPQHVWANPQLETWHLEDSRRETSTSAAVAPITSDEVRGTVRLRDGTAFPPRATLYVTVKWYDETIARRVIEHRNRWPVAFAVPVRWPLG